MEHLLCAICCRQGSTHLNSFKLTHLCGVMVTGIPLIWGGSRVQGHTAGWWPRRQADLIACSLSNMTHIFRTLSSCVHLLSLHCTCHGSFMPAVWESRNCLEVINYCPPNTRMSPTLAIPPWGCEIPQSKGGGRLRVVREDKLLFIPSSHSFPDQHLEPLLFEGQWTM